METLDGLSVAHVEGSFQHERAALTKHELTCLLLGWPPWYKEKFKTRAGREVPFPIWSEKDISRGGWIIAVGLMESPMPLAVYRCPNEPDEPGFRQNGATFRRSVARCRDHIAKNISPHFPDNQDVTDAMAALNHLINERTGSGIPTGRLGRTADDVKGIDIPHLRSSDCRFICTNFNDYEPLTDADRARLESILFPTMVAVVHGAYEVVQYLKDVGVELKIPPSLQPFDREVWLRDCTTRLPVR
ncbi:hypothetical protein TWF481_001706 [Arthrobotrys musiformis]|uniref:Uncharacterized protein n=1 Tax=Arthrobotrys musiformis TaxID=47236 RepID=A0AAV9VU83_9PEZI